MLINEAQAVPALFDAVQHLYDRAKGRYRFVLSGSSARKLRRSGANLLPGRSIVHHLFPLLAIEREPTSPRPRASSAIVPVPGAVPAPLFPAADLEGRLLYGDLPGVALAPERDRAALLQTYAYVYLEEELRREALIKDWPSFARFLRLAALESGQLVNYSRLASQAGTTAPTVKSHYQLLEDMFVGVHVPAFTRSARKHVLSTPRFLFFDLGVRNGAAELPFSRDAVAANPGPLFEQWVGLELHRRLRYLGRGSLSYLRTKAGAEVDYIVEIDRQCIPIEVKWTAEPTTADVRHLRAFLDAESSRAKHGYVVCRCQRPLRLADDITAVPWDSM